MGKCWKLEKSGLKYPTVKTIPNIFEISIFPGVARNFLIFGKKMEFQAFSK